jgi:hypothetical protein
LVIKFGEFINYNMNLSSDPVSRSSKIAGFDSLLGYEGFGKGIPQIMRRKDPREKSRKRFHDILKRLNSRRKGD